MKAHSLCTSLLHHPQGVAGMLWIEWPVCIGLGGRIHRNTQTLAKNDIGYRKMVTQIDKYWDKLFADPIHVETPTGDFTIQPQRTNNLMEQSFRFLKRDGRRKSGQHSLSTDLNTMT